MIISSSDLDGTITDGAQPSNKDNESKKPKNPKKSRLTRSMKKQHRKESDEQRRDEALLHENSAGSGAASLTEEIEQHAIGTGAQKRPQRSERLQKIHQQKEETRKSQNNSTADRSTGCTLPDTITQAARDETLYAERTRKRERNKWVKKQKAQKEARAKRLPKVGNEDLGKGPSGPEYTPQASKRKPRKPRCGATRSNNIIPTENSGAIYIIDD